MIDISKQLLEMTNGNQSAISAFLMLKGVDNESEYILPSNVSKSVLADTTDIFQRYHVGTGNRRCQSVSASGK